MSGSEARRAVAVLEADVVLRALLVALVKGAGYAAVPLDAASAALPILPTALAAAVVDLDVLVPALAAVLAAPALLLSRREAPAPWPGVAAELLAMPLVVAEFLAALRRVAGPP